MISYFVSRNQQTPLTDTGAVHRAEFGVGSRCSSDHVEQGVRTKFITLAVSCTVVDSAKESGVF